MADIEALAAEGLRWIKSRVSGGLDAELYLYRSRERGMELRQGRREQLRDAASEGIGLRLVQGGRQAFAASGGTGLSHVQAVFQDAQAQLRHLEAEPSCALPEPTPGEHLPDGLAASLYDGSLFRESWDSIFGRLKEAEAAVLGADRRVVSALRLDYEEGVEETVVASTRGVLAHERSSSAGLSLAALAEEGTQRQVGSAASSARRTKDVDFTKAGRQAGERAAMLLGARAIRGGKKSVVFDPWVAGEFLDIVAEFLAADEVQRGKSLLSGKRGRRIGSELLSLIDDPLRPGGLGSRLRDDEGCPSRVKTLVERGMLRDYFYDTQTAAREGRAGNASAGRGSYRSPPGPGASNFYLAPGRQSRESLIAEIRDGLLVFEAMGMHTIDPISGEFSVGVSGLAIENGRLAHPVRSAMIAGNLLDMLSAVDAVADDLTFYGSTGSPTFRAAGLSAA